MALWYYKMGFRKNIAFSNLLVFLNYIVKLLFEFIITLCSGPKMTGPRVVFDDVMYVDELIHVL